MLTQIYRSLLIALIALDNISLNVNVSSTARQFENIIVNASMW